MPLIDITNPKVINFLIENYDKEARLRINWNYKNREKIKEAATLTREPTNYFENDVLKHCMKSGMAAITRDHKTSQRNRRMLRMDYEKRIPTTKDLRKGHSIVDIGLGDPKTDPRLARPDTDYSPDPVMKPVPPNLKEIIYKPKPEFGREQYIKQRAKMPLEDKYYFNEGVNWDYGWRLERSAIRKPQFGRNWRLARALKSRVGPQPDPDHYKVPDIPGPQKCRHS